MTNVKAGARHRPIRGSPASYVGGPPRLEVAGRSSQGTRDRRRPDRGRAGAGLVAALSEALSAILGAVVALVPGAIGQAAGAGADRILLAAGLRQGGRGNAGDANHDENGAGESTETGMADSSLHEASFEALGEKDK